MYKLIHVYPENVAKFATKFSHLMESADLYTSSKIILVRYKFGLIAFYHNPPVIIINFLLLNDNFIDI